MNDIKLKPAYTCAYCGWESIFSSDHCIRCGICFKCSGSGIIPDEVHEDLICSHCIGQGKVTITIQEIKEKANAKV
jgi:hypothetical protein